MFASWLRGRGSLAIRIRRKDPGLVERVQQSARAAQARAASSPPRWSCANCRSRARATSTWAATSPERAPTVTPAIPAVLPQLPADRQHRLDLARWLVDPQNPLTARVTVNRMWQEYFGKGIVETENDFGTAGRAADASRTARLAGQRVRPRRSWSQKAIHRLIVTSATYRQSSKQRPEIEEVDPYNKLLARQNRLRLEAEIIRDAALSASGLLTETIGGPSVYPPIPEGALAVTQVKQEWPTGDRSGSLPPRHVHLLPPFRGLSRAGRFRRARCDRHLHAPRPLEHAAAGADDAQRRGLHRIRRGPGGAGDSRMAPQSDQERLDYAFLLALNRPPEAGGARPFDCDTSRAGSTSTRPTRRWRRS